MVETGIEVVIITEGVEPYTNGGQWLRILARGKGLTLGVKCATIDDGEFVYHGLLPIQTTDEEDTYECALDFWEDNPVWKALKQK